MSKYGIQGMSARLTVRDQNVRQPSSDKLLVISTRKLGVKISS